jgi:hypothetical protein
MDLTGAGKSTVSGCFRFFRSFVKSQYFKFIQTAAGDQYDTRAGGHDLESRTKEVSALRFTFNDHKRSLVLIDTPGSDDTDYLHKSDKAILQDIEKALEKL